MGNFVGTKNRFGMYILHICYHLEYIWDSDWLIKFITYIGLPTQISIITDPAITMYWTNSSAFARLTISNQVHKYCPRNQSQVLDSRHGLDFKQYQLSWPIEVKLRWVGPLYLFYNFRTYWLFFDSIKQWKLHQSFCDFIH